MRPHRLLGVHVDGVPGVVVRADRLQGQVERAEPGADAGEGRGVAGVAAEEHPVCRAGDDPGGPQRGVPGEEPPGEVPGLGAGQREAGHRRRAVPVQLDDPVLRHAPAAQVFPDAQGDDEGRGLLAQQGPHRREVQVVVVVVADQHGVDRGQALHRHGRRMQPGGAQQRGRRHPLPPHRVDEHAPPVDLQQGAGVTEPGDRQVAGLLRDLRDRQRYRSARQTQKPNHKPLPQQPVAGGGRSEGGRGLRVVYLAVG